MSSATGDEVTQGEQISLQELQEHVEQAEELHRTLRARLEATAQT